MTDKSRSSKASKKTPKEIRTIPKQELLKDAKNNVKHTRDHILFVLRQTVREVLTDLLPYSASPSKTELFPRIHMPLMVHANALFPGSTRQSLIDLMNYLETHQDVKVSHLVSEGVKKFGYTEYACALVLLRVALRNFGRGAGCITRCDLVGHFSPTDNYTLISHYDKKDFASIDLFDECVTFYHDLLDELDIDDLREFHNMVFIATGSYCSLLPYSKLILETW